MEGASSKPVSYRPHAACWHMCTLLESIRIHLNRRQPLGKRRRPSRLPILRVRSAVTSPKVCLTLPLICNRLIFDLFRSLASFQEDGASQNIAEIRLQHFEEKRKRKIRLIEDTIRTGVLASLKDSFPEALAKNSKSPDGRKANTSVITSARKNVSY